MSESQKPKIWRRRLALPLYLLALLILDVSFQVLYGRTVGAWPGLPALGFSTLWILLLGAIVLLLPRALGRTFIVLSVLVCAVLVATHAVMYHLFGNFFGFPDLAYAGDGAAFFSLKYLQMRKLLLAAILAALVLGVLAAVWLPKLEYHRKRILTGAVTVVVCVGGLLLLNHSMLGETDTDSEMRWDVALEKDSREDYVRKAYTEFRNPNACLPIAGLYQYTWRDFVKTFLTKASGEETDALESLDAYYAAREPHADNEYTGVLAGKNLIMIMVESLDSWMITQDYMPNLYALSQKSVQLEHFYTPLYLNAGTFATEFITQTGVIPPLTGVSSDAYFTNALPAALPRLFAAEGYKVNSFHGASAAIYNRGTIHRNLGFEAYRSGQDMGMDDYMLDAQMLNAFDEITDKDQPFYSFIITYSGHGPYTKDFDNISQPYLERAKAAVAASGVTGSEDTMDQYTRAVAQMMETDAFIGGLMDRLEQTGLLEDTAVVIYGDHYCKYLTDTDFLLSLKGAENRNLLCNTPCLIYSKDLDPQTVEKYASSVDVFPTVCNLFALKADLRYFVGDDVFSDRGGVVFWRDSSSYNGTLYVQGQYSEMSQEQWQQYSMAVEKLQNSWKTFQYDYFRRKSPLLQ